MVEFEEAHPWSRKPKCTSIVAGAEKHYLRHASSDAARKPFVDEAGSCCHLPCNIAK
jgi:hypothetical protein